mgnify:CR=1 FL=1
MTDFFAILIGVSAIAALAFGVGYFNTRLDSASRALKKLEKDRERLLKPLMSSNELSDRARKLKLLREKARRMRRD